jgi:hypothetical protein
MHSENSGRNNDRPMPREEMRGGRAAQPDYNAHRDPGPRPGNNRADNSGPRDNGHGHENVATHGNAGQHDNVPREGREQHSDRGHDDRHR